jgi:hypothetical protein
MQARRILLVAGSLWEIVRFFLVVTLVALLLQEAGASGAWVYPWLLVAASGNLLVAVGGIMLALFPGRYAALLGLLRLGKVIALFSFLLLVISGALGAAIGRALVSLGGIVVTQGMALFGVFLLDLLFLVLLFSWRGETGGEKLPPAEPGAVLPEYDETEVKDFH